MFPKISIIVPTLNQARFIDETIQSILTQNYPNLELIVLDGGSTDGTHEILKRYTDSLTWISEPDEGQVDAINKGLKMVTGEVVAYLNSDDVYMPNTLLTVGQYFFEHPDCQILTGKCININENGIETRAFIKHYKNFWLKLGIDSCLTVMDYVSQPSTFWRTGLIQSIGLFNDQFRNAMDYDYWLRVTKQHKLKFINQYLSKFRIYPTSITSSNSKAQYNDEFQVASRYSTPFQIILHKIHADISCWIYENVVNRK
ncbi:MAG: glycosyltransferase [Anaerolineae bacterium]|nr:glycosyltransferase [Anaerolineae bacterium]